MEMDDDISSACFVNKFDIIYGKTKKSKIVLQKYNRNQKIIYNIQSPYYSFIVSGRDCFDVKKLKQSRFNPKIFYCTMKRNLIQANYDDI